MSKGAKLAYRPVGLAGGLLAGLISGVLFKQIWKLVAGEDDAPSALQSEYRMREVVIAAALQGARAFTRATGNWPGD